MQNDISLISNVVVLGGNGAMGSLFCTQLAEVAKQVIAIDLQQESPFPTKNILYIQTDVCKLTNQAQNALATADVVIATLPETVILTAWQEIVNYQKDDSLLVDTLSVKTPFINVVSNSKSPNEIISINPMFAPSLGFSGQSTAVIDIRHGPIADAFTALLESWGCRLVYLTAEQHDRNAAILQTLTHAAILAFGISLQKLDYDISAVEPLMPPPHRTLLALVARILNAEPEVYWDIQSSNPYAAEARHALEKSIKELSQLIEKGNNESFKSTLSDIRHLLGSSEITKLDQFYTGIFKARDQ